MWSLFLCTVAIFRVAQIGLHSTQLIGICLAQPPEISTPQTSLPADSALQRLTKGRDEAERLGAHAIVATTDRRILVIALRRLGDVKFTQGDTQTATQLYHQALELDKKLGGSAYSPVRLSLAQSELEEQAKIWECFLGSTYNSLGTALAHTRQRSGAMQAYLSAAHWCPQTPGLDRNLGLLYAESEHYAEAVAPLTRVLLVNPGDIAVRRALGLSLAQTGESQKAIATLSPITTQLAEAPTVAYVYAVALTSRGDQAQARNMLVSLLNRSISGKLAFAIGQQLVILKDDRNAIKALHMAEGPDATRRIYYYEAMIALRLNEPSKAIPLLKRQLQRDPTDVEDEYALASTQLSQDEKAEAITHLRHVLSQNPAHTEANYDLGRLMLEEKGPAAAIPLFEAAEKATPDRESIHYQLQLAYRKAGRRDDADRELQIYQGLKTTHREQGTIPGKTH